MRPAAALLLALSLALLAAPAAAELIGLLPDSAHVIYSDTTQDIDINAYDPGNEVIGEVEIIVNPDTQVEFSLYCYDQVIIGAINRTLTGPKSEIITYRLGDNQTGPYEASSYLGLLDLGPHTYTIRYGADSGGGLNLWLQNHNRGIGWKNPSVPIPDVAYRFQATATNDMIVSITTVPSDDMHAEISGVWDLGDSWLIQIAKGTRDLGDLIMSIMGGVYLVVALGWYLFQKIFVDNFLLLLGLFEACGLAYAANKSRDIFQFARRFAEYNAKAVQAMFWLVERMVTILARVIGALKPI